MTLLRSATRFLANVFDLYPLRHPKLVLDGLEWEAYSSCMGQDLVQKLRIKQGLVRLPDGSEGVPVTLQYRGSVPVRERNERRKWLQQYFTTHRDQIGTSRLVLKPDTVSPTAQTVEAICPIDQIDAATHSAESSGIRLDVISSQQVLENRS